MFTLLLSSLKILPTTLFVLAVSLFVPKVAWSFEIVVDYRFDTQGFFDDPVRKTAIEAVAGRYSRVITSDLLAVEPVLDLGRPTTWRIGFDHPGEGGIYQLSTAANRDEDPIYDLTDVAANEYGFPGLEANQWILFAGGRNLGTAGIGGTATGTNFDSVFDDLEGPMHRGVISNTPGSSSGDLPAWGGAVTFDLSRAWNFELDRGVGSGEVDFYSIAMHEVGHALGLSNGWNQWEANVTGSQYHGENAVEAYNADNDTSLSSLEMVSINNLHWLDGAYQSKIFQPGEPNLAGTVGDGFQDLLLEPIANFSLDSRRFELTNVDAAALTDLGWTILEDTGNPLDLDGDGFVTITDVDLACSGGNELQPYYAELNTLAADVDLNGEVGFSDFLVLSQNFGKAGTYSSGDVSCDSQVDFEDFLAISGDFGKTVARTAHSVPEASGMHLALCFAVALVFYRGRFSTAR